MAYVSSKIPNLVNGISQQPNDLRLYSQGEAQINGFSSVVEGLKKRPPTEYVAKISSSTSFDSAYIHTINRDSSERYIVTFTNGALTVHTIDGVAKSVVSPNGTSYLNTASPKSNIVCTTIADYTFVVNKSITTAKSNTTGAARPFEALYSVTQGVASTPYTITINNTDYTYTTTNTASSYTAQEIVTQLVSTIGSLSGFTITNLGTNIYISNAADFTITSKDGYGSQASQVIKGKTNTFTDLPDRAVAGMVVEISGTPENAFDNYYVKFVSGGNNDEGVWEETVKPELKNNFDNDTMPHVLIRTADGNFRFSRCDGSTYTISSTDYTVPEWGDRQVGDEISASDPSFIDKKINDVFLYRNRLGFLADENIVMSRSGDFFEFYPETVTQNLDTDVIDINVSHSKVSKLHAAIPFAEELLVFSDQTQFSVGTGATTLTPETINAKVSTEFENNKLVKPVSIGRSVFFSFEKGEYSGVREYFVNQLEVKTSDDITANVPKYIPKNLFTFAAATNENMLVALSSDETNCCYVYQFYENNGQKLQSAWHKWTLGTANNTKILGADFLDAYLYFVIQRSDGLYIMKMNTAPAAVDSGASYMSHLDSKLQENTTGVSVSYSAGTGNTTITIPYTVDNTMQVVTRTASGIIAGQVVNTVSQSGTSIVVSGDYSASKFFIGEQYEFAYTFSKQYLRREGNIAITEGRLQIRNFNLNYNDTGFFTVEVTPENRDTYTYTFTGAIVGNAQIGSVNLNDGTFKAAVASQNEKLTLIIKNNTFLPSAFSSAEWEGIFYKRAS